MNIKKIMSIEDHSPTLMKKSELEEEKIPELPVKKNEKFSKLKTKTEFFMTKLHHKKPILEFMDTYFMQYIDFIVDLINSIIEGRGIYCSFFLINSMVFYHEIKMSNPTEAYKYIRRYIRRRVDICMEKDNGYGKLPHQNRRFIKENDLNVKDFPILTNYLESTHGCIFADQEGRMNVQLSRSRTPYRPIESSTTAYRGRERERSPVAYRGRERERSPVNYRERENPGRERSWSRERTRRRSSAEPEKESESTIIKMLMDQNEKLMKMVSQGQGHVQQHVPPPFVLPPPPPIQYQPRPPVPYYPPPPLHMMIPPPSLHQQYLPPTQYQQAPPREPPKDPRLFSIPYPDRK